MDMKSKKITRPAELLVCWCAVACYVPYYTKELLDNYILPQMTSNV